MHRLFTKSLPSTLACVRKQTTACQMPPFEYDLPKYEGPDYSWVRKVREERLNPALSTYYKQPLLLDRGYMQWLFDHSGRRYLDFFAGIVTVSVGHCHPKVNKAAQEQMNRLWHCTNVYLHPKIHEYASRLTEKFPGNLKCAYFVNSGSEANELAILMSRMYTGRQEILSLRNGYHGGSLGTLSLMGLSNWKFNCSLLNGVVHVMNPDVYRGLKGGYRDCIVQSLRAEESTVENGVCSSADFYMDQLHETLNYSVPGGQPAAMFMEMIQGVGGAMQYPLGYVKKACDLIQSKGGCFVADEVQTGFGRTGEHYWGFESHGIIPDIVTMAKGIGNGFPLAAVVTTPEIAKTMTNALHFNTYGGSPLATAVGISVLDAIEEDGLQENSRQRGRELLLGLEKLRDKYEIVGDVRGKGLMVGIEMVEDKKSRKPLNPEKFQNIWEACLDMGLVVGKGGRFGQIFRIKPPMCITADDVSFAVAVIDKALEQNT